MNKPSRFDLRIAAGAILATLLVLGCWQIPTDSSSGGGGGAGGSAGSLSGTDIQVCGAACQKLIDCGASLDLAACKNDCISPSNASLVTCFRGVSAACDPLAACTLDAICLGAGPSGNAACSGAGTCLVQCGGSVSQTCACDCGAQASPTVASSYYNLFVCASINCSYECSSTGDPSSCETCLGSSCYTEAQACP